MRILVIGGTGHIGTFLIPRLVQAGHDVAVLSRQSRPRYGRVEIGWGAVGWIAADRVAEEQSDAWLKRMQKIDADVVIDMVAMRPEQVALIHQAFAGRIRQYIQIGTVWAYGPPRCTPIHEQDLPAPIGDYGRNKAAIQEQLRRWWAMDGFPSTIIHPGHISSRHWPPIDPRGGLCVSDIYRDLATGQPVVVPDAGLGMLHHVHADDVAQLCLLAMERRQAALGEAFFAVGPYAMTLLGACHAVAAMFGKQANLQFVPLDEMAGLIGENDARCIRSHVEHSSCCSIDKGRELLGYQPRYTTEQIYADRIEHLLTSGELVLPA